MFDNITLEAKDFIQRCQKVKPDKQISANEIMNHPWLQKNTTIIERARALITSQVKGRKILLEVEESDSTDWCQEAKKVTIINVFKP